eukprot:6181450-Pleurochrysis_carterae.AAC.1
MEADSTSQHGPLRDFFCAAITLVLYHRQVYPEETFERRQLFDAAVYVSRCAELREYVEMLVDGLLALLRRREADALVVLILGQPVGTTVLQPFVLERFVFEMKHIEGIMNMHQPEYTGMFRGCLLKLHVCDSLLAPLPTSSAELSFRVELHSRPANAGFAMSESMREQWVECDLEKEVG